MTERTGWQPEPEELDETPTASAADEEISTPDLIRLLIAEGRNYAANEVQRQKLRASVLGTAARDAAILAFIALTLLFGALIAGLIGLIIGLAAHVGGALAATGIVIGGALLLILLLLLIARARVKKALRLSFPREGEP